jgi:hypothetical protein
MPDKESDEFKYTPKGRYLRSSENALKAWEQATKQKWRALALGIKAKLEFIESGISTFEQEFLGHILLPDGKTFGEWALPQIDEIYKTRKIPALMPGG